MRLYFSEYKKLPIFLLIFNKFIEYDILIIKKGGIKKMKVIDEDNNFIVDIPDHILIIQNNILNLFNWYYRVVYVSDNTIYVKALTPVEISDTGRLKECKLWT